MKLLVVLILLLLVAAIVVLVLRGVAAAQERRLSGEPWRLAERSDGEMLTVHAVRPGAEPLLIGAVAFAADDFGYRIEELRAAGDEKLVALNARQLRRGG